MNQKRGEDEKVAPPYPAYPPPYVVYREEEPIDWGAYWKILVEQREAILRKMKSYFRREIGLSELVSWGQEMVSGGDLSPDDESFLRELVTRAGDPASGSFGLTMEDWSSLLGRMGQDLRVSTGPLGR